MNLRLAKGVGSRLFDTGVNPVSYALWATVIAFGGSIIMMIVSLALVFWGLIEPPATGDSPSWAYFWGSVAMAPAVETVVLAIMLKLLQFLLPIRMQSPANLAFLLCALFVAAHATVKPALGIVVAPAGFVYSAALVSWQQASRPNVGFACAISIHAFHNCLLILPMMIWG
jgi:hypothetical protein